MSRLYDLWYYSRLQIWLAAFSLTCASGSVLLGRVDYDSAMAVACGTAGVYWFDDVVDSRNDERARPGLARLRRSRLVLLAVLLLGTIYLCARLLPKLSSEQKALGAILLAAIAAGSLFRWLPFRLGPLRSAYRAVLVSFFWTVACVLSPVLNAHAPITVRTLSAIGFVWILMLVVCLLWNDAEHQFNAVGTSFGSVSRYVGDRRAFLILKFLCVAACLMVLIGIVFRIFPPRNLVLLFAVGACWLSVTLWRAGLRDMRLYSDFMVLTNAAASFAVVVAYDQAAILPSPRVVTVLCDVVEGIALIVLVILIGKKTYDSLLQGFNPIRTGIGKRGLEKWLELLFLGGLLLWMGEIFIYVLHLDRLKFVPIVHVTLLHQPVLALVGAVLVMIGIAGIAWSYQTLGDAWRIGVGGETSDLVMSGPFQLSRNPIYVSAIIYLVGTAMIYMTPVFLLFVLIAPLVFHTQILEEERFLKQTHGAEYEAYRRRTKRYL